MEYFWHHIIFRKALSITDLVQMPIPTHNQVKDISENCITMKIFCVNIMQNQIPTFSFCLAEVFLIKEKKKHFFIKFI